MTSHSSLPVGSHERISATARAVAYFRSFSDIPYATETSRALGGEEIARLQYGEDLETMTKFAAPLLEARYRSFDRLIERHGSVLELAVGTSIARGLAISEDPNCFYVGTDLPEVIRGSEGFLNSIADVRDRKNHYLRAANVLVYDDLRTVAKYFGDRRDLLIINEGLWFYLTFEEQKIAANNIRRLLEFYGGKWVTPDIWDMESNEQLVSCLPAQMQEIMQRSQERTSHMTGRDIEKNYPRNRLDSVRVLEEAGFKVEQYPMADDLEALSSVRELWADQERSLYEAVTRSYRLSVMSLR